MLWGQISDLPYPDALASSFYLLADIQIGTDTYHSISKTGFGIILIIITSVFLSIYDKVALYDTTATVLSHKEEKWRQ